jgi:uncharacterized membrane protein
MSSPTETPAGPDTSHRGQTATDPGGRWSRLLSWHVLGVGLIAAGMAGALAALSVIRLHAGFSGLIDLGIFDQTVHAYAHFHAPHASIVRVDGQQDPGLLQLGDHFSPLLAALAPLYWIHDGPATLQIAQGVLFALAVPPLWIATRRILGTFAAYLVAIGFALAWPLQSAAAFDFHEVALAVPVMAWMLERALAGRHRQAALVSLLLLLVKEDMGFVVAMLGIYLALRGSQRLGAALFAGGLAAVAVTTQLLIPAFGGSSDRNWTYQHFGNTPGQAAEHIVRHPLDALHFAVTPGMKWSLLGWLLLPLLCLPLLSPISLLAVPLLVERMFSSDQFYWLTAYQYNAYLVAILFFAGVDGANRLARLRVPSWLPRLLWPAAVGAVSAAVLPHWPLWDLTKHDFWAQAHNERAVMPAIARVPVGADVGADSQIGVHMVSRTWRITAWPDGQNRYHHMRPAWVVTRTNVPEVKQLLTQGYQVTYRDKHYLVLHNPTLDR